MAAPTANRTAPVPARGPRHWLVAVIFFLAMTMGWTANLRPASGQDFNFTAVRIEGNVRIEAATILAYAGIARGRAVSAAELNEAYQRILASGLFEEVELVPAGATLVIRVREWPTISVVAFEGNRRIDDEALARVVRSQSRHVYSPSQAEADAAAIVDAYRQAGRYAAIVTPKIIPRSDNRIDLVFEIREGAVVEIERISFVGNRAFSNARLRRVLETKQAGFLRTLISSDTFNADRIEFDKQLLTDFYRSRGFVDFEVLSVATEIARERDAFFITYTLREGQPFRVGAVTTTSEVAEADPAEFERLLRLRPGETYSPMLIETNIARLENHATRAGLSFVRVEPRITRHDRELTLDVEFAIIRGPRIFVERIDIEGNSRTLDQVIRRQFRTVEGDPFNPREIREAAERIRALGHFTNAAVEGRQGSTADQVIIDVDVEEAQTGSLTLGASYSITTGAGFVVSFSESNFLGRGQYLGLSLGSGVRNTNSQLTFVEPAFLDRDLRFRFSAYRNLYEPEGARYSISNLGFNPSIEFPVRENTRLELRYRLSEDRIYDVDRGDPDNTLDNGSSAILRREEGAKVTSALGYTLSFDNRTTGIDPYGGVLLRFSQDFAGLGGEMQFISTTALLAFERRIMREEVTLRAELEGGALFMASGNSRLTDRFTMTGKIRGFEPNGIGPRDLTASNRDALGGNYFFVARLEAEFPLGLPEEYGLTGGLFVDVGSLWGLDDTAGTSGPVDDSMRMRAAAGFSLFWKTPIGPLRMNFATPLVKEPYDREQFFDLTISTRF
ncbi:MAG: outer membrane protein assembly factor BamA [Rhodobacteraceae bacterium]|nr:outer membrane protein assembly factor BamA [Paracoccaceae bacterium]